MGSAPLLCIPCLPQAPVTRQQQQRGSSTRCARGKDKARYKGAICCPHSSGLHPGNSSGELWEARGALGVWSQSASHRASLKEEQGYILGGSTGTKLAAGTKQGALEKHRSALATWLHPRKISPLHQRRAICMLKALQGYAGRSWPPNHAPPSPTLHLLCRVAACPAAPPNCAPST